MQFDRDISFQHQQIKVNDISIHTVTAGKKENPPILFLHGYPETWLEFEKIMNLLKNDFYVISIELPGIGTSGAIASSDKNSIAGYINDFVKAIGLKGVALVGHDVGGMIVYSMLKLYPELLSKAIIMNVSIPGIEPWSKVKQNSAIWHFSFHKIPNLPELLVKGHERKYFDYFFDTIAKNPGRIDEVLRASYAESYANDISLKTSFDWYRTFDMDEKNNIKAKAIKVDTPLLYLRGDAEYGEMGEYLKGFGDNNITNVKGKIISNSGHYAPEEAPGEVAEEIKVFIKK